MIRYIVFDTETTGLNPLDGDRIIEIGAVELIDKKRTGKTFHQLINPKKKLTKEITKITHITDEMLINKPVFQDIANDFLLFLKDQPENCEKTFLVAHNASFDIKFLNNELKLSGMENLSNFDIIDTIELAHKKFPNHKVSLDLLCEKFGISLEQRKKEGHGALLDSQILVDVFLKLIEGSTNILEENNGIDFVGFQKRPEILKSRNFKISTEELEEHKKFLQKNNIDEF